jgi:hypothetical protein
MHTESEQEKTVTPESIKKHIMENAIFTANNVWMMLCTGLVFFMHLGFSFLEIGLTTQKKHSQHFI